MGRIKELQQTHKEISEKFKEQYGGVEFNDLDEDGCNLLIERLEAELKLKEATIDSQRFNRLYKPVILQRITRVKILLENQKWLKSKVKT